MELEFESASWLDHALEFDVSCRDETVVGPRFGWMWRDVVVELPADGRHSIAGLIRADQDETDVVLTAKRCDTDCTRAEPIDLVSSHSGAVVEQVDLSAGRHVVRIAVREERGGPVAIGWGCPD
jgi:hypothetical protein